MERGWTLRASVMGTAVLFAANVFAPSAWADFSFDLTATNLNPATVGPGPYVHVDVHLTNSTTATVTYTGLTSGSFFYLIGDPAANVNAVSWTTDGFNPSPGLGLPTNCTTGPSAACAGQLDGFGNFNQTTKGLEGASDAVGLASFVLHNTGGTWASDSVVLTPNASGQLAATHLFVCSDAECTGGAIATGFAGVPGPVLGAGVPGVVMACGGLLALARRRRQKIA